MKFVLLVIGKTKESYLINGIELYNKRIQYYINLEIVELNKIKNNNLSKNELRKKEGEYILKNIKPVICLEIGDLGVEGARKSKDVIQYVLNYGYKVFEFKNERLSLHKLKDKYNYGNLILKYPKQTI